MGDENVLPTQASFTPIAPSKMVKDTFALVSLSTDPFLKQTAVKEDKPVVATSSASSGFIKPKKIAPKVVKPVVVKVETPLPEVKYFGYIKSKEKTEELILVKVNTTLYKTRLNSDCAGVVIKEIYRDSIEIAFEKRKVVIRK